MGLSESASLSLKPRRSGVQMPFTERAPNVPNLHFESFVGVRKMEQRAGISRSSDRQTERLTCRLQTADCN